MRGESDVNPRMLSVALQLRVLMYSVLASGTRIKKPYRSYKRSSSPPMKTTGYSVSTELSSEADDETIGSTGAATCVIVGGEMSVSTELLSEAVDETIGSVGAATCVIVADEMSVSTELSSEAVDETIGSAGATTCVIMAGKMEMGGEGGIGWGSMALPM
jgi:hypothetical protein